MVLLPKIPTLLCLLLLSGGLNYSNRCMFCSSLTSIQMRPKPQRQHTKHNAQNSDNIDYESTFVELLEDKRIEDKLAKELGVLSPNEMQSKALSLAKRGSDMLVISQTGSGKTLTFILPILSLLKRDVELEAGSSDVFSCSGMAEPRALVLVPTAELVAQHEATFERIAPSWAKDKDSSLVHFDTPDSFIESVQLERIGLKRLGIVALDEVDAILCGGRDDSQISAKGETILALIQKETPKAFQPQFIFTTAYLSASHGNAVSARFPSMIRVQEPAAIGRSGVLVPSLRKAFHYFSGDKDPELIDVYRRALKDSFLSEGNTLVFCSSSENAEHLVQLLYKEGASASGYLGVVHNGIDVVERKERLNLFRQSDKGGLLVCTEVIARGLDVQNVRHVILFDVPSDVANFVHQVGRTARRGQSGVVTALVRSGFGSSDFTRFQHLHALNDAPRLKFDGECD